MKKMTDAVVQPDPAGRPSTTIDTEYTPCSLEFCPSRPRLGVCGFYQTQQKEQPTAADASDSESSPQVERIGRCVLFEASHQDHRINYQQLQSFDCPAVLDQRWTQDPQNPILITADAQGDLNSYTLNDPFGDSPRLDRLHTFACCPTKQDVLCLSLDISDKRTKSSTPKTICSLSNGQVVLLSQHSSHSSAGLLEERRWDAHLYEPWTCAFDYWQPETVFTGGDDCQLKVWDTRDTLHRPVLVNKQFDGGVTAIRSDHLRDHMVAVGSYDSRLRIFDKRNMSRPVMEEDCGGGIWRIKWDDRVTGRLLLATMHSGFRVLQISEDQPQVGVEEDSPKLSASVVSAFTHRSGLAYGADWTPFSDRHLGVAPQDSDPCSSDTRQLIGGCSFYDRALHFWTLD